MAATRPIGARGPPGHLRSGECCSLASKLHLAAVGPDLFGILAQIAWQSRAASVCQLIMRQRCMATPNPVASARPSIPAINLGRLPEPLPCFQEDPRSHWSYARPAPSHHSHLHAVTIACQNAPSTPLQLSPSSAATPALRVIASEAWCPSFLLLLFFFLVLVLVLVWAAGFAVCVCWSKPAPGL